jgi:hypothetical protein
MGIEHSDIQDVIGRWVEHTLQMEVKYTISTTKFQVENTSQ